MEKQHKYNEGDEITVKIAAVHEGGQNTALLELRISFSLKLLLMPWHRRK